MTVGLGAFVRGVTTRRLRRFMDHLQERSGSSQGSQGSRRRRGKDLLAGAGAAIGAPAGTSWRHSQGIELEAEKEAVNSEVEAIKKIVSISVSKLPGRNW